MNEQQPIVNLPKKGSLQRNSLSTANRGTAHLNTNMKKLLKSKTRKTINETIELYSRNSFFCLSKRNKIRLFFINLIEHIWFERVMTIIVLLSSITMLLYSYKQHHCASKESEEEKEKCLIENESEIYRDEVLDKIFVFYNLMFLIEMICKMIAKGLLLHKRSYLRNGRNILDCFVTIYSLIETLVPRIDKTAAFRVIRLLRVITSVTEYHGIRRLIASIIISLPTLGNVLLFLGFIYVVFSVLGIQLFSGTFYTRCRLPPIEIIRNDTIVYYSPPYFNKICAPEGGSGLFKCPAEYHCVSFFDLPKYFNLTEKNITIDHFDINDEGLKYNHHFNYGVSNFDNILNCFINVFCFMTYQNWAEILTILLDGFSSLSAKLFFISIVTVGGFFIMKLILAAQNEALIKVRREEMEQKMKILKRLSMKKGILEKENIADLCREMDNIGTGELIQNIKNLNISFDEKTPSGTPVGARKRDSSNSESISMNKSEESSLVTLIPMFNPRNSSHLRKSNDKNNISSVKSSISNDEDSSSCGVVHTKGRSGSVNKNKKNSILSKLTENTHKRKSRMSEMSNNHEDPKFRRRSKKASKLIHLNEVPTFHQNRGILLIENLEFDHHCKHLKKKINELKGNGTEVDPYVKDSSFSDDENYLRGDEMTNTNLFSPEKNNLIKESLEGHIRRRSAKLVEKNTFGDQMDKFKNFLTGKFDKMKEMTVGKIKYLILEEFSTTPHYIIFNLFVYSITFLNLIYLCMMSYPMEEETSEKIQFVNIFCSSVFVLEIIFKLTVLGCRGFFKDKLNVMDFVVVNLGIIEMIAVRISPDPEDDANSSLSSFRALRFIRLLKLFKKGFIQRFVNFIIISLRDLVNYCFLLGFFIFIFSIAGRELFAHKISLYYKYDKYNFKQLGDVPPRVNFDSIFESLLTVFILFIGDNWPEIMYDYAKIYEKTAYLYFVIIIVFGNIMLFNLFLSIMMSNYNTEFAEDLLMLGEGHGLKEEIQKLEKTVKGWWKKIRDIYEKFVNCCGDEDEENAGALRNLNRRKAIIPGGNGSGSGETDLMGTGSNIQMKINLERLKDLIPMIRKSLFIFPKTNKFREFCWRTVTTSRIFEYYLMINIVISLIILAIDNPALSDPTWKKVLYILDAVTTFAFIIEFLLKVIAFGFLFNGKYSYIRYGFNIFDFVALSLSISYIIVNTYSVFDFSTIDSIASESKQSVAKKVFRIVKILRIVRVFKLVQRSKSLQATLSAFYVSLKQMLSIILIGSLFILMFSVVGMTYFRGLFYRCNFEKVPEEFMYQVVTKWDCIDYGGEWINPYPNFDNIKSSFILLFEMMTTEGWIFYMFASMDAVGFHYQPVKNNRAPWAIFFVVYMIFAYFFLLNLAISILSDNFKKEKSQIENTDFIPLQKEFFDIYKSLYKVKLPKNMAKTDKVTKVLLNILDSIYFDVIITMCIISNLIILMMNWPGKDDRTAGFINLMNSLFGYIFVAEAFLKIYVFRCSYFSSGWNIVDFILICDTLINLLLKQFLTWFSSVFDSSILRAVRVARILRMIKKAKSLNRIFNLFLNSIPGVVNIAILYFILLFVYSVIGMSVFSFIKYQKVISEKWNFQDFPNALLMLVRLTSGEGWNTVMHECLNERTPNYYCKYYEEMTDEEVICKRILIDLAGNIGCGTIWAIPYFMSFIILSSMMFLEFFSVIIASTVNDTYVINLHELKKAQLNKFKRKWITYDKDCTGFMLMDHFQKFLFEIGFPLGISSMKTCDYVKVISLLDIYTYDDKKYIFFYDVLTEMTKYYMIHKQITEEYGEGKLFKNNEETVEEKSQLFESMNNDLRELKQNVKLMILDPYYNNEKYKKVKKDKLQHKVRFSDSEYLRLHYSWAIKKISKFTRLYMYMKSKCLVLMDKEIFNDQVLEYSFSYLENVRFLDEQRKKNSNETIHEIEEEDENSQSRSGMSSRSGDSKSSSSSGSKSQSSNSHSGSREESEKIFGSNNYSNKDVASAGNKQNSNIVINPESGMQTNQNPKHEMLINDFLKYAKTTNLKNESNTSKNEKQIQNQESNLNINLKTNLSGLNNSVKMNTNSNFTFKKNSNSIHNSLSSNPNMSSFRGQQPNIKNLPILNSLQQRFSSLSGNQESANPSARNSDGVNNSGVVRGFNNSGRNFNSVQPRRSFLNVPGSSMYDQRKNSSKDK